MGVSDFPGDLDSLFLVLHRAVASGNGRYFKLVGEIAGSDLVPGGAGRLGGRADELDVARFADFGEVGVLGEEAVARVNRVGVADFRGADDPGDVEVALLARSGPDADGVVRLFQVDRVPVRLGVDADGVDSELAACPHDAEGDFAPVRYENSGKHFGCRYFFSIKKSGSPNSIAWPFLTRISRIVPFISALISFIIFIASMMQTTLSAVIESPTFT